jgi:Uma2 family endonuclease
MVELSFESTTGMTQDQFSTWAEARAGWDPFGYELLNGRVVMTPPAGYPHGEIGSNLQFLLVGFMRAHRLGKVFDSSQGFELPSGDTVEPDHSFVSWERWNAMPAPKEGTYLRVVPDLVIEVLSNATATRDRGEKRGIYERNGVREYLLVDWRTRTLSAYALEAGHYREVAAAVDTWVSTVLVGLTFRVSELIP